MATKTRVRNSISGNNISGVSQGTNLSVFTALCAEYDVQAYGSGQPLYELVKAFGGVVPLNTLDTALQSFDELREGLKEGDAAFSYSEEFNRFTLALKLGNGGITFVSLLHDQNGTPRVEEPLQLCWVKASKDFEWEGDTIIRKGQQFIKALPQSYLSKMKTAA